MVQQKFQRWYHSPAPAFRKTIACTLFISRVLIFILPSPNAYKLLLYLYKQILPHFWYVFSLIVNYTLCICFLFIYQGEHTCLQRVLWIYLTVLVTMDRLLYCTQSITVNFSYWCQRIYGPVRFVSECVIFYDLPLSCCTSIS